jgi:hypothetical protein
MSQPDRHEEEMTPGESQSGPAGEPRDAAQPERLPSIIVDPSLTVKAAAEPPESPAEQATEQETGRGAPYLHSYISDGNE